MDTFTTIGLIAIGVIIGAVFASILTVLFSRNRSSREQIELKNEYHYVVANLNAANDKYAMKLAYANELEHRLEKNAELTNRLEVEKAALEAEVRNLRYQQQHATRAESEFKNRPDRLSNTQMELKTVAAELTKLYSEFRDDLELAGKDEKPHGSLELVSQKGEQETSFQDLEKDLEILAEEFEKEIGNLYIAKSAGTGRS